jgi:GNAT superfamily N-acetyltransferase
MELTIRPAEWSDLDFLIKGNAALAWESEGKALSQDRLRAGVEAVLQDQDKGEYFVAEVSRQVVGQVLITREWSDWRNGWFWWIQSVYVTPAMRSKGVYRCLHNHIVERARQAGNVVGMRLYVESNNHRAQRVYERCGMQFAQYQVMEQLL